MSGGLAPTISAPYRLKRIRGVRRVEYDPGWGWIARDQLGNEIMEDGFRWRTRSVAWSVALEADIYGPFPSSPSVSA